MLFLRFIWAVKTAFGYRRAGRITGSLAVKYTSPVASVEGTERAKRAVFDGDPAAAGLSHLCLLWVVRKTFRAQASALSWVWVPGGEAACGCSKSASIAEDPSDDGAVKLAAEAAVVLCSG
jgi:hypothetical protein